MLEHLLVLETDTGVVTLADVAEVIDERLHHAIVFVIDVLCFLLTEVTLLEARITAVLVLIAAGHIGGS